MKRNVILAVLAIFIISVNGANAAIPVDVSEQIGNAMGLTVAYSYDGYCDGATLNILSGKVTGDYTSPCASCPQPYTLKGITGKQNGVAAAGFKYTPDMGLITVVRADHTWTHYSGGTIFNSGTWTQCAALDQVAEDLPASTTPK